MTLQHSRYAPISLSNDLLTGAEWSPSHTRDLLQLSADIKARPGRYASTLTGKFIALIFEKPSLRTRVTFDVGIQSMGGNVVFLDHTQAQAASARANPSPMSRATWNAGCTASSPASTSSKSWTKWPPTPTFPSSTRSPTNSIPARRSPIFSPSKEHFGALRGFQLAYVGDGNNVCHSLMYLAARLGVHLRIATPSDYTPLPEVVSDSKRVARETRAKIELLTDPREAVSGAQAVYTDSWTSMGFEAEEKVRNAVFRPIRSTPSSCPSQRLTPSSCTASRRIAVWKSPPKFSTARNRSSSTNPKIACTCRKPFCTPCSNRACHVEQPLFFRSGAACCATLAVSQLSTVNFSQ